jgi:SAM-dependent methyltransferase
MQPEHDNSDTGYRDEIVRAVTQGEDFVRLTLGAPRSGTEVLWRKVTVRPIALKDGPYTQFLCYTDRDCVTENLAGGKLRRRIRELLALPFTRLHLQTRSADLHVRITRRGKALVTRGKPSRPGGPPDVSHDRRKARVLQEGRPDEFLVALGVMTPEGRVHAAMQGKFRQINEFLRVIAGLIEGKDWVRGPVSIVDCGCGNAYLTFATHHYLKDVLGVEARVVGVDANEEVVGRVTDLRDSLGLEGVEFRAARILDFEPERPPEIVLSLHACDTATDEAIAQGVRWGARVILAAPCCQHELHRELKAPLFRPVTRHGIMRERLADLMTDACRALALRIMGYRTDVIQFIDPSATSKNLMIRAERGLEPGHRASAGEYRELKEFWQVEPAIERLLGEPFRRLLGTG